MKKFNVGDVVVINWDMVEEDGSVTEEMRDMRKKENSNTTYTISKVDNTSAYPYILEGYEHITSFDGDELVESMVDNEPLF